MPYSVSPRRKLMIVGLKPSWKRRTRMPTRLAARKWPSSCTNTSTPRTNANERIVVNPESSDFQFYPSGRLLGILASPAIDRPDRRQRPDLFRPVRVERQCNDVRNRGEADATLEEPRHRHLVGGVQHDRQAAFGVHRAVGQSQARERVGIRHIEVETPRARQIE